MGDLLRTRQIDRIHLVGSVIVGGISFHPIGDPLGGQFDIFFLSVFLFFLLALFTRGICALLLEGDGVDEGFRLCVFVVSVRVWVVFLLHFAPPIIAFLCPLCRSPISPLLLGGFPFILVPGVLPILWRSRKLCSIYLLVCVCSVLFQWVSSLWVDCSFSAHLRFL